MHWPTGRICTSLWHLKRNLRRNQGTGRSAKGKPKLKRHGAGLVLRLVSFTAALPSRAMFAVAWDLVLRRARTAWQSRAWASYFAKTYLRRADLATERAWTADWYYGTGAMLPTGALPSQQPVEQSHSAAKRALRHLPPTARLTDLLDAWRAAFASWCAPPDDDDRYPGTLKANRENFALAPTAPDDWMLAAGAPLYLAPYQASLRVAPIPAFLRAIHEDPSHWCTETLHGTTYHCLGLFRPDRVDPGWLRDALRQLLHRRPSRVLAVWEDLGFAVPRAPDAAPNEPPLKLSHTALRTFWTTAALLIEKTDVIVCTCMMASAKSHCEHKYVLEELLGRKRRFGHVWPRAASGAAALRRVPVPSAPLASEELDRRLAPFLAQLAARENPS